MNTYNKDTKSIKDDLVRMKNIGKIKKNDVSIKDGKKSEYKTLDEENRIIECYYSTEKPYRKFVEELGEEYDEILVTSKNQVGIDLERLNNDAPVLYDHNPESVLGKVTKAWIEGNKCCATLKFSNFSHIPFSERTELQAKTEETWEMIKQGTRNNVSFMYTYSLFDRDHCEIDEINKKIYVKKREDYEISVVNIPADPLASFRSYNKNPKEKKMENKEEEYKSLRKEMDKMDESEMRSKLKSMGKSDEQADDFMRYKAEHEEEIRTLRTMMKDMEEDEVERSLRALRKDDDFIEDFIQNLKEEMEESEIVEERVMMGEGDKKSNSGFMTESEIQSQYDADLKKKSLRSNDTFKEMINIASKKGLSIDFVKDYTNKNKNYTLNNFKAYILDKEFEKTNKYNTSSQNVRVVPSDKRDIAKRAISNFLTKRENKTEKDKIASHISSSQQFSDVLHYAEIGGGMKTGEDGESYMSRLLSSCHPRDSESQAIQEAFKSIIFDPIVSSAANIHKAAHANTRRIIMDTVNSTPGVSKANYRDFTTSDLGMSTMELDQTDIPYFSHQWKEMQTIFNCRPVISKANNPRHPQYNNIKFFAAKTEATPELSRGPQMEQQNYDTIGAATQYSLSLDKSQDAILADNMGILDVMMSQFGNARTWTRNAILGEQLFGLRINDKSYNTFTPTFVKYTNLLQQGTPDLVNATTVNVWNPLTTPIYSPGANTKNWLQNADLNVTNYNDAIRLLKKQAYTINGQPIPFYYEPQYLVVHEDDYEVATRIFRETYPIVGNVDSSVFSPSSPSAQGLAQALATPLKTLPIMTYREADFYIPEGTGDHSWFITSVPIAQPVFFDMKWGKMQGLEIETRYINEERRWATSAFHYDGFGFGVTQGIIKATPANIPTMRTNERANESYAMAKEQESINFKNNNKINK